MKSFILFLLLAFSASAAYVEIGNGTSGTRYVPVDGLYDYSWSQTIYLQSELKGAVQITGISYYVDNSPSSYAMPDQHICMKHTSLSKFPDASYETTDSFVQVFNDTVTWNGSGWNEIVFDVPFDYNGTDNLVVYWQNYDGDYTTGYPRFRYTTLDDRCKYEHNDSSFPDESGSLRDYVPNVRFHYTAAGPGEAGIGVPADGARNVVTNVSPTLIWSNPSAAVSNLLYFSTNENAVSLCFSSALVLCDGSVYSNYTHAAALIPGTVYYWRVVESDGTNTTTGFVWSFTTELAPVVSYPWSEGFECGGEMPMGWDEEYVVGTHSWNFQTGGYWNEQPPTAHSGTYNAVFIHQSSGSKTRLVTPPLDLSAGGAQLTFWHVQRVYDSDQDELRVYYRNAADGEWTLISGAIYTSDVANWTQRVLELPEASATYWIAFEGYDDYGYGVCIDDVTVSVTDTPVPSDLRAESLTQTNAVLRWNGGDAETWSVEWGETGFIPGEGTAVSDLATETDALEGLNPGTSYDFYVCSHFSAGDSDWSGPVTFTTRFAPVSIFPWNEGFESGDTLPQGWTEEFVDYSDVWQIAEGGDLEEPSAAHGGVHNALFASYDGVTRLVTRELDLGGLASPQLSFWYAQRAWNGDQDELRVYLRIGTNGTWTLLSGAVFTEEVYEWTQCIFTLPSATDSTFIAFEATGFGGYGICLDDVRVEDAAYPMPGGLSVDALYSASAEISWSGSAVSYTLEWGVSGFTLGTGTQVTGITGTFHELTGLSDKTEYDVYVKAVYADGASGWAGPETFDTFWGAVNAFPWLEDFESGYDTWDQWNFEFVVNEQYWLLGDGGGSNANGTFPDSAYSGEYNARFISQTGSVTRLISRELDLSGLTHPELSFFHAQHVNGRWQDELRMLYRVGEEGTWHPLPDGVFTNNTPEWQQRTLALPEPDAVYFIGFEGSYFSGYGICLDDVRVYDVLCVIPTNLTVGNVTGESADIACSGTADSWNIEWGAADFELGDGTRTNGILTSSYTLEGLDGWSEYNVYIQAVCGVETSNWAGPINFVTLAGKITSFPWTDDFDPWTTIFDCWTNETILGVEAWSAHAGGAWIENEHYPDDAYSGGDNVLLCGESGNIARLISPQFDLSSMTYPRLRFQHAQHVYALYNYQDELRIYYRIGESGTWTLISGAVYTADTPDWTQRTLYLPDADESYFIAFEGNAGWGYGVCVDDVIIDDGPVPPPLALRVENVTHTSVDLHWDGAGVNLWNLEWGLVGFTSGAGTLISGLDTNIYSLAGLVENTAYDFYVQEDRGAEQSAWTGPAAFTTLFSPVTAFPWRETFEHGGALPAGWSNPADPSQGVIWKFDIPGGEDAEPVRYAADYDHTTGSGYTAWIDNSDTFSYELEVELLSPSLDLNGVDFPMLSFYYWIGRDDLIAYQNSLLYVDLYNGSIWTNAVLVLEKNGMWQQQTLDLTPWKSSVSRIRFRGVPDKHTLSCDIALDDVEVYNCICPPDTATPVGPLDAATGVSFSGTLQWNAVSNATGYKVWLGTDYPPTNIADGVHCGLSTTFEYSGLPFNTNCYWKVVPWNSGGGDALNSPIWSFTTVTPVVLPFESDFETDDGGFAHGGSGDEWQHGTPAISSGLNSGYNGSAACWATDLDGDFIAGCDQYLVTPWISLAGAVDPVLDFRHIVESGGLYPAYIDPARVEITTDGSTWSALSASCYEGVALDYSSSRLFFSESSYTQWNDPPYATVANDWWRRERFSLSAWNGDNIRIRFRLTSTSSYELKGWYIDNVVFAERYWTLTASAGDNGSMTPSGEIRIPHGDGTNFVITADSYFHVDDVDKNGLSLGSIVAFAWDNVTADGTIAASFAADLAAQGTPHWWLADYGWLTDFDLHEAANPDKDPYTTLQEYVLDYNPTVSNDWFRITAVSNNSPFTVYFESSALRNYTLLSRTNLTEGTWQPLIGPRTGVGGGDAMTDDGSSPANFYKLRVACPQ